MTIRSHFFLRTKKILSKIEKKYPAKDFFAQMCDYKVTLFSTRKFPAIGIPKNMLYQNCAKFVRGQLRAFVSSKKRIGGQKAREDSFLKLQYF